MTKTIRVIKTKKGYVSDHEYSQGYSSYATVQDPLKAIDLNNYRYNPEFTLQCMLNQHEEDNPVVEEYEITVTKIS